MPPLPPLSRTGSPMWNFILHCLTRWLSRRDTSAFIQFTAKKGCQSRYARYILKQRQHPAPSILLYERWGAQINTIINVIILLSGNCLCISVLYWDCCGETTRLYMYLYVTLNSWNQQRRQQIYVFCNCKDIKLQIAIKKII